MRLFFSVIFSLIIACVLGQNNEKYAIVIHGGAGNIIKSHIGDKEKAYHDKLEQALALGVKMIKEGEDATQVVIKVIQVLEESPLFNAGRGAVYTYEGTNELDASIMDGKTLNAGAVASVKTVKSPIELAYNVMVNSKHVMLSGKGASEFAKKQGLEIVNPEYFSTRKRKKDEKKVNKIKDSKHGTVGCVVLDKNGNLAAGTSTGGMSNKRYGRIGDSPIIGAGTYANNSTCAVSCTGHGEYFIRHVVAYSVSALMEMKGLSLKDAANYMINEKLVKHGGSGGLIAVDKEGNICMPFNTNGMFRAYAKSNGESAVLMYK